jgi:hypothetical protein
MAVIAFEHGVTTERRLKDLPQQSSAYCYMFPDLAKKNAADFPRGDAKTRKLFESLDGLAGKMDEIAGSPPTAVSDLQAVYTYFGQFVNHDLSAPFRAGGNQADDGPIEQNLDLAVLASPERTTGPEQAVKELRNEHPAPMTLNSLYGSGPFGNDPEIQALYKKDSAEFALGQTIRAPDNDLLMQVTDISKIKFPPQALPDLPRDAAKNVALIADQRNDENLVISQLHLAFMLFHNNAVQALKAKFSDPKTLFDEARKLVTWHYQWCILNDFLKRLLPSGMQVSSHLLTQSGCVPLEFTTAAFRFGHSMVSDLYDYNENFSDRGALGKASLRQLFNFTSRQKMGGSSHPSKQLPDHWVIDWQRFLKIGSAADRIDPAMTANMAILSGVIPPSKADMGLSSICHRNLKRGFHRYMASGQDFAAALNTSVLKPDEVLGAVADAGTRDFLKSHELDRQTPAWFYFLCEAKVKGGGNKLGPAAATIIAETIHGLLRLDPGSAVNAKGGSWRPKDSPLRTPKNEEIDSIGAFLRFSGTLK